MATLTIAVAGSLVSLVTIIEIVTSLSRGL
jgi:hypothetical protein